MNFYKKKLLTLLFGVTVVLLFIALTNYLVDPAKIYRTSKNLMPYNLLFLDELVKSEYGLIWENNTWNERDIKQLLAQNSSARDCAIIGSSRVMQIGSKQKIKSLQKHCKSIINLGVSGASLEDYLALSWELLNNPNSPSKIFFGVDPWALNYNRDFRWERYRDSYNKMKNALYKRDILIHSDNSYERVFNLINLEYFVLSINSLFDLMEKNYINKIKEFDHDTGADNRVILPDGSYVYSRTEMSNFSNTKIPIGGSGYKLNKNGLQYSENAIKLFSDLVSSLIESNKKVFLLLTPYHDNVVLGDDNFMKITLTSTEKRIRHIGELLKIDVMGSYSAQYIGCSDDEFFDEMHPKSLCLSKI